MQVQRKVTELSPEDRAVLERLLGRALEDSEVVQLTAVDAEVARKIAAHNALLQASGKRRRHLRTYRKTSWKNSSMKPVITSGITPNESHSRLGHPCTSSMSPGGSAARLIAQLAPPRHQILLSEFILDEFRRVMTYPRIQRRGELTDIDGRANRFRMASAIVEPAEGPPVVSADPKDDPIVYTAVAGKADVLCTLDRHFQAPAVIEFLRTRGIRVLSDVELLRELLLARLDLHSA